MHSVFGNTYVCEITSSGMKHVKSKSKNRMANETLDHSLRLATTNVGIDKERTVSDKDRPQASHDTY